MHFLLAKRLRSFTNVQDKNSTIPHKLILGLHLSENFFLSVLFPRFHIEKGLFNPWELEYNYAENP